MAVAQVANAVEWGEKLAATAALPSCLGYRVLAGEFGPISAGAPDQVVGKLVLEALDYSVLDVQGLSTDGEPPFIQVLGAKSESEVIATGRMAVVSRRDSRVEVRAQGTDGRSWSGTRSMPRVAVADGDASSIGAAVREMLAAFTTLGPEEPGHT